MPSRRRTPTMDMKPFILLPTLACLILIVAHRARGFSSGAPEESCASLTVNHTHVGSPAPGVVCDATCRVARKLRLIGSSADNFTYSCNQSYQCELDRETHAFVFCILLLCTHCENTIILRFHWTRERDITQTHLAAMKFYSTGHSY